MLKISDPNKGKIIVIKRILDSNPPSAIIVCAFRHFTSFSTAQSYLLNESYYR